MTENSGVILCRNCGCVMGTATAPTRAELVAAAKGSAYAGIIGMIPTDFVDSLAKVLVFTCHKCNGGNSGNVEKECNQKDGGKEGDAQVVVKVERAD